MSQGDQLIQLKESASEQLKKGQYQQAIRIYKSALTGFDQMIERDQITTQAAMQRLVANVKIPCMKNISLCYLKLKKYKECIELCDQILGLEPQCCKTIYRKGTAHKQMGDLAAAETILRKGFFINPNQKQIQKSLAEIEQKKVEIATAKANQQKASNSWIMSIIRLILLFLIPANYVFRRVFNRDIPLYNTVDDWAHGRRTKLA